MIFYIELGAWFDSCFVDSQRQLEGLYISFNAEAKRKTTLSDANFTTGDRRMLHIATWLRNLMRIMGT